MVLEEQEHHHPDRMNQRLIFIAAAGAGLLWYLSKKSSSTGIAAAAAPVTSIGTSGLGSQPASMDLGSILGQLVSAQGGAMGGTTTVQAKPITVPVAEPAPSGPVFGASGPSVTQAPIDAPIASDPGRITAEQAAQQTTFMQHNFF